MIQFMCPARKAKATLKFPILYMEFENSWPKVQEFKIFRATLYKDKRGQRSELRGPDMDNVAGFLSTLNPKLIKCKEWDFDRFDVALFFTEPVSVGEYASVTSIVMTHYGWWANTEAMKAAHLAWLARVGL
jgi:hypothetical protein